MIGVWLQGDGKDAKPLSVVKVHELLARQGCVVPYRTLHRFAVERCGFRVKDTKPARYQASDALIAFLKNR